MFQANQAYEILGSQFPTMADNGPLFGIILSILVFGGIWGVLGVFFAIPLATFIQAVINGLLSES